MRGEEGGEEWDPGVEAEAGVVGCLEGLDEGGDGVEGGGGVGGGGVGAVGGEGCGVVFGPLEVAGWFWGGG